MKIYLLRHTETNYNLRGLSNSDASVNVYLTKLGVKQAEELASSLESSDFEIIIVSTLSRTKQTADIINRAGLPVLVNSRLDDLKMGFEGKPVHTYLKNRNASSSPFKVKFNDGESLEDANQRVIDFLLWLNRQHYSSVLIISHLTIVQLIYGALNGLSLEQSLRIPISQSEYFELDFQ